MRANIEAASAAERHQPRSPIPRWSTRTTHPLARPIQPTKPLPFFKFLRVSQDNFVAGFHEGLASEPIYERRFLWFRSFIINDPSGIKRVLLENRSNYTKADILRPVLGPALGTGLVTSDGETWRSLRKLIAPVLDPRSVEGYGPVMTDATRSVLTRWLTLPNQGIVEINEAMGALALEIISRAMFSADSAGIAEVIERSSTEYQQRMTFGFCGFMPLISRAWACAKARQGRQIVSDLDRAIYRLITMRCHDARQGHPQDLLDRLIAVRDGETGLGLSRKEIRDQVVTMMMAGHETTASALSWIWYLLSQHPTAEERLHQELDDVLHGRPPTAEDVARLSYTRMIIQEGLRLYPPVHTLSWRQAVADDEICGRRVPKGSIIWIVPWLLHRNPAVWKDPERFEPDRFADERNAARQRFAYLPFSTGPRVCIGATFAMTEAVLILASIAQVLRLRVVEGHLVEPQALVTLRPRHGIQMVVERR
jgi:cytochrome P450